MRTAAAIESVADATAAAVAAAATAAEALPAGRCDVVARVDCLFAISH